MKWDNVKPSEIIFAFVTLVIAITYYWMAQFGFLFAWHHTNVSAVWPPTALSFIVIFSLGYRFWPGIWLGAFLANVAYFLSNPSFSLIHVITFSALIAIGNTLEALIISGLLKKLIIDRNPLHKVQDVFKFMVVGLLGCAVCATIGSISVCLSNPSLWSSFPVLWMTWWLGDSSGLLTIAPLFLAVGQRAFLKRDPKRIIEFLASFSFIVIINGMIFNGGSSISQAHVPITYVPLALTIWLTYRFGYWGAIPSVLVTLYQAIVGTNSGYGPFVMSDLNSSLILLQSFIITTAGTTLLLAAALYERRQAQKESDHREKHFRALVENSLDMIVMLNPVGVISYSSPSTEKILGYRREEHEGHNMFEFIHPKDESNIMGEFTKVLTNPGQVVKVTTRVRHKDGSWRWIEGSGQNLLADPVIGAIVVNYRDITERKQMEETIRVNEQRLKQIIDLDPHFIFAKDIEGRFILVNEAVAKAYGSTIENLIGKTDADFNKSEEEVKHFREDDLKVIRSGKAKVIAQETITDAQGQVRYLSTIKIPFQASGTELPCVLGVAVDITDSIKAQEANILLAAIVESSNDAILSKTLQGIITSWNKGAEQLYGYTSEEIIGRSVKELCPENRKEEPFSFIEKILKGEKIEHHETIRQHKDGHFVDVSLTISPIRNSQGVIIGASVIGQNITERKRAEEILKNELKQASRLADIGTLAAIVAHELRTPLGVIQMAAHNLKNKHQELLSNSHLSNIEKKVWEGNRIIDNLLSYSRIKAPVYEPCLIVNLIEECISNIASQFQKLGVEFTTDYKIGREFVLEIDANQIREVLLNIINNACQAVPPNQGRIQITAQTQDEGYFNITIKDNGSGIDTDDLERVFQPFFTTKAKGTGLGLPICNELINLHRGRLDIQSVKGQSTTIQIILPIHNPSVDNK